jgi:hypothetical protein
MEGSGVATYRVLLEQTVSTSGKGQDLDLFLETSYGQYFNAEDNYQFLAGTTLGLDSGLDRLQPGLFIEVAVFRDDLVADDEYDELLLGGSLQWHVNARFTLFLQQTFAWTNYQNPVSLPGQRMYRIGRGKGPGGSHQIPGDELATLSRDDESWFTELSATTYLTANVLTDMSFQYRDLNSSNDFESFRETGGSVRLEWLFSEKTAVFISGFWFQLDYDTAPQNIDRCDDVYGVGIGGSRRVGGFDFYFRFNRMTNDSPVAGEAYEKSVIQCGTVYSF